MIHLEFHRYVFDKTNSTFKILVNTRIIGQAIYKDTVDHTEIEDMLKNAYKRAKQWTDNHEGRVIGKVEHDGIHYTFEVSTVARLFQRLIEEGYVLVVEEETIK